jgi:hypothetical protein
MVFLRNLGIMAEPLGIGNLTVDRGANRWAGRFSRIDCIERRPAAFVLLNRSTNHGVAGQFRTAGGLVLQGGRRWGLRCPAARDFVGCPAKYQG